MITVFPGRVFTAEFDGPPPDPPELVKARFVDDAPLVGAVALALASAG